MSGYQLVNPCKLFIDSMNLWQRHAMNATSELELAVLMLL